MELFAIEFNQFDIPMYLVTLSVGELKDLWRTHRVIADIYDPTTRNPGYQRVLDEKRTTEISEFISKGGSSKDVLPPLLPGAIVLNCRQKGKLRFENSKLLIPESVELYVIDGQHRLEGLCKCDVEGHYQVPIVIVDGLGVIQEAGQFLMINTKQKKVRPDLQLRVLYNLDRNNTHRLVRILSIDNWRLEALTLCIALNDNNESSWRNMILRPGEPRKGRWKPITEGNFVDTLRFFCGGTSPVRLIPPDEKETFLIDYWNAVCGLYRKAFGEREGRRYFVCKSIGVGSFNFLAPLVFHIKKLTNRTLPEILEPIAQKFALEDFWRRPRGGAAQFGSGGMAYKNLAVEMTKSIPGLWYINETELQRLQNKNVGQKILDKAYNTLLPIHLRSTSLLTEDVSGYGCYVLVEFGKQTKVYVGKSKNTKQRLAQHPHRYNLYNKVDCKDEREMEDMEMALYHLVDLKTRENENHPSPTGSCMFC